MPKTEILSKSYIKLVKDLKSLLIEGLLKAQAAVEKQKLQTYWQAGKLITKHILESQNRAGYGKRIFILLAIDLDTDKSLLYQTTEFYRTFPNLYTCINLSWSQCRALSSVKDKQKKGFFLKQAVKENWSVEKLQDVIRIYKLQLQDLTNQPPLTSGTFRTKLKLVRGKLYTYKLIKPERITPESTELLIDCGFDFWEEKELKGLKDPKDGQIVESIPAKNLGGSLPVRQAPSKAELYTGQAGANVCGGKTDSGYKFKTSEATKKQLYTYKAFVESVIDADTIWVNIDLGFKNWARQKLRFRGIDAPEISTQKGQKAKEFVEATLSKVSFIIIRSTSLDKYSRPLSDIFYLPLKRRQAGLEGEDDPQKVLEEGIFLNQELLDKGLARLI